MKSVSVFALFVLVAIAKGNEDELKQTLFKVTKECAEKTNFSEESLKKLHAHDPTESENIQCFQKCFFENSGIINASGIDEDKIVSIARVYKKDESKIRENIATCSPLYKAETFDCNSAWEIYRCFHPKE